jgi:transposase-like protein
MDEHRQTVGYYDATGLTAPQRDELIVRLRRRGYTYRKIAKVVRMSPNGVMQALRRMADPAPLDKARNQVLRQGRDPRA